MHRHSPKNDSAMFTFPLPFSTPLLCTILTLGLFSPPTPASTETPAKSSDVVIVGAGVAGLTAGFFLQDCSLTVLEKNDRAGGRAMSGTYQGFTYAKGTEYLGKPEGTLAKIVKLLKLQPKEIPAPMDARFHEDHFYYGDEGLALMYIENSSLEEYNRFVTTIQQYGEEYEDIPNFDWDSDLAELDQLTARQWFDQQKFSATFYAPYNVATRGLFGANLDEISALSVIPEIAFDYEDSEPVEEVEELSNSPVPEEQATGSYTFLTGITEVTDALANSLQNKLQLGSTVTQVTRQDNGDYLIAYTDPQGATQSLSSKVVILAVPAPIALKLAPTVLTEEQQKILQQIPYASYVTVALFSQPPIFNQAFDLSVPDGYFFTDVYDGTWVQRFYDESLKDRPEGIMTVYIAPQSYQVQTLLKMTDEEILKKIYIDLDKLFPGVEQKVVGHDIQRFPYAYPVMTVGAYKRLSRLHEITSDKVLLAGDYMIYPTFEAAVESGYLAARKAVESLNGSCRLKISGGQGIDEKWQPVATVTEFMPSVTTKSGLNGHSLTLAQTEEVNITEQITVDPAHLGQRAEFLSVATFLPSGMLQPFFFMRDGSGWQSWDGRLDSLTVAEVREKLTAEELFTVYEGSLQGLGGEVQILVGYRLPNRVIIYDAEAIELTVTN